MYSTVTISSKRQITIPAKIFNKLALRKGDVLEVEENNGRLIVQKETAILNSLKGFLVTPIGLKNIKIDDIIQLSKAKHFKDKYRVK